VTAIPGAATHVGRQGTVAEQVADLVRWIEGPSGPGLVALQEALEKPAGQVAASDRPDSKPRELASRLANSGELAPLPPSGLWVALKGRFDFWMAFKDRQDLLEKLREFVVRPRLSVIDLILSSSGYEEWPSRPPPIKPRRPNILVSGPVGVGKTTFLHRLISEMAANADLVLRMTGADLSAVMREGSGDPRMLWGLLYKPIQSSGYRRLSPEAVSYALARRRTVVVVEDVHQAGRAADAFAFFRDYLAKHHRPGRYRLVLTTREPLAENDPHLPHDSEVICLEPLKGTEPGEFFWALCARNGIKMETQEIGRALSEAFKLTTTRTPLFVVICVWLVVNVEEHRGNVEQLLQMDRAKIFKLFIKELYARREGGSTSGGEVALLRGYDSFLRTYEKIALRFWPETSKIQVDDLDEHLGPVNQGGEGWTTERLIENGFLYRPPENDRSTLSFPHQAVAEYLAAKAMIDKGSFEPLCEKVRATTNLEGFVGFLAELIGTPEHPSVEETLVALARDELSAFIEVAKTRPELVRGGDPGWYERLVRESAQWATASSRRRQPTEVWEGVRELFTGLWSPWAEHLCKVVRASGASSQGVHALAVIGDRRLRALLDCWLERAARQKSWLNSDEHKAFRDAAQSAPVCHFLEEVLREDGVRTARGWNAFRLAWASAGSGLTEVARQCAAEYFATVGVGALNSQIGSTLLEKAWESGDVSLRGALERWIEAFGPYQSDENLKKLVALGTPALITLAQGCSEVTVDRKRFVGLTVARCLDKVLISPGEYKVLHEGQTRVCRVNSALLVPCKPRIEVGRFETNQQALNAVRRQVTMSTRNCMNVYQAEIAIQHFVGEPGQNGVEFLEKNSGYREVILNEKNALTLAVVTDPTRTGLQTHTSGLDTGKTVITRVAFREVEFLQTGGSRLGRKQR
jgi:hypothetical protein